MELYDEIMNPKLLVRRIAISANHVVCEGTEQKVQEYEQLNLFTDYGTQVEQKKKEEEVCPPRFLEPWACFGIRLP